MKNIVMLAAIVYSGVIAMACAPRPASFPVEEVSGAKGGERTTPQEAWERDWQKVLAAARTEGRLNIYTVQGNETRQAFGQAMRERFGLDIEWTSMGRAVEVEQKLLQERRAGLYIADAFLGGITVSLTSLKPAGILEPIRPLLVLPEVVNEKAWLGGQIPFLDKEKTYVVSPNLKPGGTMLVNSDMVKPGELSSVDDLLQTRWKGRILMRDFTVQAGTLFTFLLTTKGPDFWPKFVENRPVLINNERLSVEWLAHGKYPVLAGIDTDLAAEFIRAGAPVRKWVPQDAIYVTSSAVMSLINRPPHPNAARVFANWYLSREGAELAGRISNTQAFRLDVPSNHLSPDETVDPSFKYLNASSEEFSLQRAASDKLAKEIFGPLAK